MARISSHCDLKPYQVAVTQDKSLPVRKWDHLRETVWAVTSKDAAYHAREYKGGDMTDSFVIDPVSVVYCFPDGLFVRVRH